ncbi:MAG: right-handed parallel beta-helix repeat-containing protein [Acidobacteriota bacterium]|nr:right-handed parallel beta-helix repeat-containing protein [Acidobacteriota bacterium]
MRKTLLSGLALLFSLSFALWGRPERSPTPTPAAPRASENPPDVPARERFRPTPPQPESKFPPPQQSREEEERESNQPGEPQLLRGEPGVFLDGEPFPPRQAYQPNFPEARRLRYVAGDASNDGDGSFQHPWKDLQDALCKLEPGDRLLLSAGIYSGSFRIAGGCRDGTAEAPIQVYSRHAFLKPSGSGDVLTVERSHWQFWEVQIALLDSTAAGFVTGGARARHIAVDQSHIYEGKGPAVRLAAGSEDVVLSNCHIHQSMGVRIERGAARITLVNNHIHHNRSASVTVGAAASTGSSDSAPSVRDVSIVGNRIHNDRGAALELAQCEDVKISRNRFSNYRPDEDRGGTAIEVGQGCRGVRVETNSVLEATVGVSLGSAPSAGAAAPSRVVIERNYLENRLTSDGTAVRIESGRDVRFSNNVVDHYSEAFRVANGAERVVIANNLVLAPRAGFHLPAAGIALFDFNVFGATALPDARIGGGEVSPESWKTRMPHSRLVPGLDLKERDLGRIVGFAASDAGKALDGVPFKGAAPDIGVAER